MPVGAAILNNSRFTYHPIENTAKTVLKTVHADPWEVALSRLGAARASQKSTERPGKRRPPHPDGAAGRSMAGLRERALESDTAALTGIAAA